MASLKPGDVVTVTKLDRLGRSTRELLELINRIGKAGAAFRSLGDPLFDTTSSQGRLLSTLLAAICEFERDLIRERTGDGRKRAMAAGAKFRRTPKLSVPAQGSPQAPRYRRGNAGGDRQVLWGQPVDDLPPLIAVVAVADSAVALASANRGSDRLLLFWRGLPSQ